MENVADRKAILLKNPVRSLIFWGKHLQIADKKIFFVIIIKINYD